MFGILLLLIGIMMSVYGSVRITGITSQMRRVGELEDPQNGLRRLDNELSSVKTIIYWGIALMAIGLFI